MIDGYILLDRYRHTGVIVRATQIITIQSFGQISKSNTPVREQSRYIEDFYFLVFRSVFRFLDFLLIVKFGMGDFVNDGRDSLHFTHTLTDSDFLLVQREIAVRAVTDRENFDGNGRRSAQSFHKDLVVLNIARKVGGELR